MGVQRINSLAARLAALICILGAGAFAQEIAGHRAVYDATGILKAWSSWDDIIAREMNWFLKCPKEHGYPRFVSLTFMDGHYAPVPQRGDTIPAMQNGMGIISYLKYYAYKGKQDPRVLAIARAMGDFLVQESNTPDTGKYPRFPRSTGKRFQFPQPEDCGTQADHPYEIQPDKGGIAAYALTLLYEETGERKYLEHALHVARVLAANMGVGDATHSPWPFRADFRTGEPRGPVGANQSFTLRLFDKMIEHGYTEFNTPRDGLWAWIRDFQIPDASKDAVLWVQFFEDYALPDNRNAWSPLNLARYLVEKQDVMDPRWREHSRALLDFVVKRFTSIRFGVPVCGEQDDDKNPWGGVLANYGGVLALYTKATGDLTFKALAYQALSAGLYATGEDGCPRESITSGKLVGWVEDAHTDKIHNFVDAVRAFPEWAK